MDFNGLLHQPRMAFAGMSSLLRCDDDGEGDAKQQPIANPCSHAPANLH